MTGPRDIPDISRPDRNRRVVLQTRPTGIPQPEHFAMDEVEVPTPAEGEVLVRNVYLSADPAQRGWAADVANYSEPVPLGGPMRALAVGQVVQSRAEGFAEGDFVYGFFGWQDYAAVAPTAILHRCTQDLPLEAFGSVCSINGVTAYLALTELGRPKEGDTLLVSTAAGSVGGFVGQIGKSLGCRTVGLTGSDDKVALCSGDFGYDAAINYRTAEDLGQEIADAAPEGVDVYFDNVGGDILDTALRRMNVGGRVVQCGTASIPSWSPLPTGPRNEREILTRRLVWSGFIIFDHLGAYAGACDRLTEMHLAGQLTWATDLRRGIDHAPGAIADLYAGRNTGKLLIQIT